MGRACIHKGGDDDYGWELVTHPLPPVLRPYVVKCYGYFERTAGLLVRNEVPISQVVLIIELGPPIEVGPPNRADTRQRYPGGFLAGLTDTYTVTRYEGWQRGIEIFLTPMGTRALFRVSMTELTNRVVLLSDLLPASHRSIAEQLAEAPSWDERFAVVHALLSELVRRADPTSDIIGWACQRIASTGGGLPIRQLSTEVGYSEKHLRRLFYEHVGVSPKLLARLVRFERLVDRLKQPRERPAWADLAAELGYYDQSHLVRDVRQFAGTTPTGMDALIAPFGPELGDPI